MRRVERLINLIAALLDADVPMTAEEIRTRIAGYEELAPGDGFRRAFERDKADLKAMGIPLETVRLDAFEDTPPGYVIPKSEYYLPELDLEPDELAALRIAAGAVLGVEEEAGTGMLKLSLGAIDEAGGGARLAWNADVAAAQPLLGPLYSALIERVPVSFGYQAAGSDEVVERTVDPYALLHRRGHWYLVGRDHRSDESRTFKVPRIASSIRRAAGGYDIPADFDAATHLSTSGLIADEGGALLAKLRFDPALAWWPRQNLPAATVGERPDGSVDVELPVTSLDALTSFTAWWGTSVEILAPPEGRVAMKERAALFSGSGT